MIRLWHHPDSDLPGDVARHPGVLAAGAEVLSRLEECMVVIPERLSLDRCRVVHDREYVDLLADGRWKHGAFADLELPLGPELLSGFLSQAGGTVACVEDAMICGVACSLGGGFHHAGRDRAEGFCLINDVAVAVTAAVRQEVGPIVVVDCDVHQGNGTAAMFQGNGDVVTISVHSRSIYPVGGPSEVRGDVDIALDRFTDDETYLEAITDVVDVIKEVTPDLVVYMVGTDVFYADQLGDFLITADGMQARDRLIITECIRQGVPLAMLLMAGYPYKAEDQIMLWTNCWQTLVDCMARGGKYE